MAGAHKVLKMSDLETVKRAETKPPRDEDQCPTYNELLDLKLEANQRWRQNEFSLDPLIDRRTQRVVIDSPGSARILLEYAASYLNKEMYRSRLDFIDGYHVLQCFFTQVYGLQVMIPQDSKGASICAELATIALDWSRAYCRTLPWKDHEEELNVDSVNLASVSRRSSIPGQPDVVDYADVTRQLCHWKAGLMTLGAVVTEHDNVANDCAPLFANILASDDAVGFFHVYRAYLIPIFSSVENCILQQKKNHRRVASKMLEILRIVSYSERAANNGIMESMEDLASEIYKKAMKHIEGSPTDVSKRSSDKQLKDMSDLVNVTYAARLENAIHTAVENFHNFMRDPNGKVADAREAAQSAGETPEWLPSNQ